MRVTAGLISVSIMQGSREKSLPCHANVTRRLYYAGLRSGFVNLHEFVLRILFQVF